jgi:hypothetical protein
MVALKNCPRQGFESAKRVWVCSAALRQTFLVANATNTSSQNLELGRSFSYVGIVTKSATPAHVV